MSHYSHGMRLRMGMARCPRHLMDFCMGMEGMTFSQILMVVLETLAYLSELKIHNRRKLTF